MNEHLPVPVPKERVEARPEPSVWSRIWRGTVRATCAAVRGAANLRDKIHPDVRREMPNFPLLGLVTLVSSTRPIKPEPDVDSRRPPVLFVHGFGGGPKNFGLMRAWFRVLCGRRALYVADYRRARSFEEAADMVRTQIAAIVEREELGDHARIDIVGHSMGGIVTRLALEDRGVRARVGTLITLGSPHNGSWPARYLGTAFARGLVPSSDIMERLRAQVPHDPSWPRVVAFWSQRDILIVPAEGARLEGAASVQCDDETHLSWLVRPRSIRRIIEVLDTAQQPDHGSAMPAVATA